MNYGMLSKSWVNVWRANEAMSKCVLLDTAIAKTQGLRPPTHISVRFRGVAKSGCKYCQCTQLHVLVNNWPLGENTSNCNFVVPGWLKPGRPAAETSQFLLLCCAWQMCWCSVLLCDWYCSNRACTTWLEYFCLRVCVSVLPKFPHCL